MTLANTIRSMLEEGKKKPANKDEIKLQLKDTQAKIKKMKAAGKDVAKLETKVKTLRKQLKEEFNEGADEDVSTEQYTNDGVNVLDPSGEIVHVADDEDEAKAIVAKLNDSELHEADEDEDKDKKGEDEGDEDINLDDIPAPEGDEDLPPMDDEAGDKKGDEDLEADEGSEDDLSTGDDEEDKGDEDLGVYDSEIGIGDEVPDEDRVTVVVVSPDQEEDEEGKTKNSDEESDDLDPLKKEGIEALLSGESLNEEFKEKTRLIFETALNEKLNQHKVLIEKQVRAKYAKKEQQLKESYDKKLEEQIQIIEESVVEKIDSFLNFEVDQWVESNKVALVSNLRAELTEEFIDGLKVLFKEHYIEVPEERFDLIGAQEETIKGLSEKLDETVSAYSEMKKEVKNLKRERIVERAASGLVETQKSRLEKLVESIDFDDEAKFEKKVQTIKETYFGSKSKSSKSDVEVKENLNESENKKESTGAVSIYAKHLSRSLV